MKFYETHFDDYIKSLNYHSLHSNLINKNDYQIKDNSGKSTDEYNFDNMKVI